MRRARARCREAVSLLAVALVVGSCGEGNPGFDPPANQLAFPSGLLLDPRVSPDPVGVCDEDTPCAEPSALCTSTGQCRIPARWMLVTNANSDRRYNAGSLLALDLERFWAAAFDDPDAIQSATKALIAPEGWLEDSPVCGSPATQSAAEDGKWCRRVANMPQMVECLAQAFICSEATVHFGNFPGKSAAWDEDPSDDEATILVPVHGDPSVSVAQLRGGLGGDDDLRLECGQASDDDGGRRCDDDHRLRFMRNDPDGSKMAREPFRILVSTEPEPPLAYVTHQGDPDVTVIALDGLGYGGDGRPAMIHQANLLGIGGQASAVQGGFGIDQRPCDPASAPNSTLGCTRPLVYAAMRWQPQVRSLTAIRHQLPLCDQTSELDQLDPDLILGLCEPQAEPVRNLFVGELSTAAVPLSTSLPILADLAFSRTGNELFVVQSNPGALLRLDTSIGPDGETVDLPAGRVEVCSQPTSFTIYDDGGSEYGIVTCYRSGEVFIIDLASLTVVGLSRAGIGPDALTVDLAREVVYVANSLDATISVIEMSPASSSRFTQIARIGRQEPYTR